MRKALLLAVFLIIPFTASAGVLGETERDFKPQKFETVVTITYNSITLEKAKKLESIVKKQFNDACKVDMNLNAVNDIEFVTLTVSDGSWSSN